MMKIPRAFVGWEVLVVDDEQDNLEVASRLLKIAGATVTMASNGDGKLNSFADIYGRDAPVIASFAQPRQDKIVTTPAIVVPSEAPGA